MNKAQEQSLANAAEQCRRRGVILPTFAQMRDPALVPQSIRDRLENVGLWDVDPLNLFRITWKNEPTPAGGRYNAGNWIEFPPALTGTDARIVGLVGKWFPTGAHKVGAGYGCLVPRLVSGAFDPTTQKAVWPSTGNFCRGGAFDCALLGCEAVAILPEGMSRERFDWLRQIGAEVIATPGCESNVREIYDKCWEIRRTRPDCTIFNQFEEFGNACWHHAVTGPAFEDVFNQIRRDNDTLAGFVSATGSAGTIAAGDYLRTINPAIAVAAVEALQCPTMLLNGYGDHRIEGIGDKHIPWIHNVRNTDVVCAVDDEQCIALMRLFNEEPGAEALRDAGVPDETVARLPLLGISSICNLVAAIKHAKLLGFGATDVVMIPLTDSMELYESRLNEQRTAWGPYTREQALAHIDRYLAAISTDHMREQSAADRRALHNLKYFTWVEQQQRELEDLERLWDPDFWTETFARVDEWDRRIEAFNQRVGLTP